MFTRIFQKLKFLRDSNSISSSVDFQLSFLLLYAVLVHAGFLVLTLLFLKPIFSLYYVFSMALFLSGTKYINSKNFPLFYWGTWLEVSIHVLGVWAFFGVSLGVELYYFMMITVGSNIFLLPKPKRFQTLFYFGGCLVNGLSYLCVQFFFQMQDSVLSHSLTYKIFFVYSIVSICGMCALQAFFFTRSIVTRFTCINEEKADLRHQANYDVLTELYNRRKITDSLKTAFEQFKLGFSPLALCLGDIDKFKQINDTYGHNAGDYVLRTLGQIMRANIRKTDPVGRWGGEEFLFFMYADKLACWSRAESLRKEIELHDFIFEGTRLPVTITFGVADAGEDTPDVLDLIEKADRNLYKGKKDGRNRTVCE